MKNLLIGAVLLLTPVVASAQVATPTPATGALAQETTTTQTVNKTQVEITPVDTPPNTGGNPLLCAVAGLSIALLSYRMIKSEALQ